MNINKVVKEIQVSTIRKVAEKARNIDNVINLTIGEPDLPIPEEIKNSIAGSLFTKKTGYPQLGGILELREKIATNFNKKYNSSVNSDEILITVGSTEALSSTIKTIVLPGDEVLAPLPIYPGYEPLIKLSGGFLTPIDIEKEDFNFTLEHLKKYITPKTKAVIVTSPSNPTGKMVKKEEIEKILDFISKKDIYLISDEVYSELLFDIPHATFFNERYKKNVIIINGFSKSHSLTGLRVGYLITNKELRNQILKVHQYSVTSSSIISQYAALTALDISTDERRKIYSERARAIMEVFSKYSIPFIKPDGGLYLYLNLKKIGIVDSFDFVLKLLEKKKIALIPGIAFKTEGFVRISLIKDINTLKEVAEKISLFILEYKKG